MLSQDRSLRGVGQREKGGKKKEGRRRKSFSPLKDAGRRTDQATNGGRKKKKTELPLNFWGGGVKKTEGGKEKKGENSSSDFPIILGEEVERREKSARDLPQGTSNCTGHRRGRRGNIRGYSQEAHL